MTLGAKGTDEGAASDATVYTIDTLHVGTLVFPPRRVPVHAWLVRGPTRTILVDAGMPVPELVRSRWGTEALFGGPEALTTALSRADASPEDIDTVILTHLHFDHSSNLELLEGAQVILQRRELLHAVDPVPTQRGAYSREVTVAIVGRRRPQELLVIEGDYRVADGIDTLLTPGHTPGQMGVIVRTSKGRVGLPSDAGDTYRNWYPADPRATEKPVRSMQDSLLPPEVRTEAVVPSIAAMRRFRDRCDIVVPAHEWRVPPRMPDHWWALPEYDDAGLPTVVGDTQAGA